MIQAKINPVPILAVLVLGAALTIVSSCNKGMPDPTFETSDTGRLVIENTNKVRMVFFRGKPSKDTYIGGVPANMSRFRLDVEPGRFVLTGFVVEEYVKNMKDIRRAVVAFSSLVDVQKSDLVVHIGKIRRGGALLNIVNNRNDIVRLDLVYEPKRGLGFKTNYIYISEKEERSQKVIPWEYAIYPHAIHTESVVEPLTNSFILIGLFPPETNTVVIK